MRNTVMTYLPRDYSRSPLVDTTTRCRACSNGDLVELLDLGVHAVSDFYDEIPADELKAPLCLLQCCRCELVQLSHSVSKERLYRDYWYRSGTNESMVRALADVVDDARRRVDLHMGDVVFDIGANDGTLLSNYGRFGLDTCGFEPSQLWREAVAKGHHVVDGFYPQHRFAWKGEHPKIITSIAMFYDLDDPTAFIRAIKQDLHPTGIWINQMMDLGSMLWANAFDNICHEHVAYWSERDFANAVREHSLQVSAVGHNDVNGGSTRFIVEHGFGRPASAHAPTPAELRLFRLKIVKAKADCLKLLAELKREGKTVLGYGASTKGNTLLQYYGITPELLPAIAERNPDKVGKLTAGSHIPIISEEELRARRPDYLLILPWHFVDGFVQREAELRAQGTRFIVPLPILRVM